MRKKLLEFCSLIFVLSLCLSCGSPEGTETELQGRVPRTGSESWRDAALVNRYMSESVAVRVNALTNYATFYQNGRPISKWKVATARAGYATPKGIFRFHSKEVCPAWNSGSGQSAAPCADNNPLGRKALWFLEGRIYGLHGVNWGAIGSVTRDNPRDRDASAGCVRNHPENIEWLFSRVNVGTPVVVGLWNTDPDVVDCSGRAELCNGESSGPGLLPSRLPTWCAMNVSEGSGRANVRSSPTTASSLVQQLERHHKVQVTREVSGQLISGSSSWYFVEYSLGGSQSGYLHSSLLDCTR